LGDLQLRKREARFDGDRGLELLQCPVVVQSGTPLQPPEVVAVGLQAWRHRLGDASRAQHPK
jgi:hypothetical protein